MYACRQTWKKGFTDLVITACVQCLVWMDSCWENKINTHKKKSQNNVMSESVFNILRASLVCPRQKGAFSPAPFRIQWTGCAQWLLICVRHISSVPATQGVHRSWSFEMKWQNDWYLQNYFFITEVCLQRKRMQGKGKVVMLISCCIKRSLP